MSQLHYPPPKVQTFITVNKKRQTIYVGNVVYLENQVEFEIEFFNTSERTLIPTIKMNGEIFKSSPVIYPGQRFFLEDFMTTTKKLLFVVYSVENSSEVHEIIKNNGDIEIWYYYEKKIEEPQTKVFINPNIDYAPMRNFEKDLDTGKIMKGSDSNNKYRYVEISVDRDYVEYQKIKLLPISRKTQKTDCPKCSSQISADSNYCSKCGEKLIVYMP